MKVYAKALDAQLQFDTRTRLATVNSQHVNLRNIEFNILECLAIEPRSPFSHERIIQRIYGEDIREGKKIPQPKTIRVYVCRLRKRLASGHPHAELFIQTIRNASYCFDGTEIRYA